MKMKLFVVFAVIFALIVGGCTAPAPDYNMQPNEPPATSSAPEEPPEQPDAPEEPPTDLSRLKPLELLGYFIDENGDVWTDSSDWEICDPDVFRQYMFGTWEDSIGQLGMAMLENGRLILDDSEKAFGYNLKKSWKYLQNRDTIIFLTSDFQASVFVFWIDINEPQIMYVESLDGGWESGFRFSAFRGRNNIHNNPDKEIGFLMKTDAPINEPENGYMSRLRLHEIMRDYDIDFDTIFLIENEFYVGEEFYSFRMDGGFNTLPIYLVSEEPDKLVFKSSLICGWLMRGLVVDIIYTTEKINGEWERTVEADNEQFEEIFNGLFEG